MPYRRLLIVVPAWMQTLGYAEASREAARRCLREFFRWCEEAGGEAGGIRTESVGRFFDYLAGRTRRRGRGGRLSLSSLKAYHQALRLLARYLWQSEEQSFEVPPLQKLLPGGERAAPVAPRALVVPSRSDVVRLYRACSDDLLGLRDRAMLSLYYGCGLRRSEGTALDVGDVLFARSCLYVRRTKTRRERYVPLVGWVHDDLRRYEEETRRRWAHAQERAFLVSSQGPGERIGSQSLALRLVRLGEQARLGYRVRLHSLRHAVATHLLEAGLPLERVAQLLGHRTLEATQLYTHLAEGSEGSRS